VAAQRWDARTLAAIGFRETASAGNAKKKLLKKPAKVERMLVF